MRLLIIFMILATGVYVGAFFITHDPGIAVNSGGVVAFVYLIILIINATKPPFPRKLRLWVMVIATISIAGIATAWITMYYESHWQRTTLLTIRNVIVTGVMRDTLAKRAQRTIEAYHDPNRSPSETFADVFNRINPRSSHASNILDTFYLDPTNRRDLSGSIYVKSITDSEVTLFGQDEITQRQDSIFKVLNMKIWKPKATLYLTPKGGTYELEQ